MSQLPNYQAAAAALASTSAVASTSESHGLLTGLFCSGKISDISAEKWATLSVGDAEQSQSALDTLKNLFSATQEKLANIDFSFNLLLPDDDTELRYRAKELGAWCDGFINGLKLGNIDLTKTYSKDCNTALQHITEISQVDYENFNFSEADEEAYVTVVEYLRLAILAVYMDLTSRKETTENVRNTLIH